VLQDVSLTADDDAFELASRQRIGGLPRLSRLRPREELVEG
jgi:hypothetical protein